MLFLIYIWYKRPFKHYLWHIWLFKYYQSFFSFIIFFLSSILLKLTLTLIYERRLLNEDFLWVRCKGWLVIIFRDNLIDDSPTILLQKILSLKTLQIKILMNTLQLIIKRKSHDSWILWMWVSSFGRLAGKRYWLWINFKENDG